jgi:hypothetical protein
VIILNAIGKIRTSKTFLGRIWTKTFDVLILPMALRMITTSKVVFRQIMTFDVLFNVVIFVVVINSFQRCDNSLFDVLIFYLFDVLIALMNLFNVVIVYWVFGVLFDFWRCEICSSDLFPKLRGMIRRSNFMRSKLQSWRCNYNHLIEIAIFHEIEIMIMRSNVRLG